MSHCRQVTKSATVWSLAGNTVSIHSCCDLLASSLHASSGHLQVYSDSQPGVSINVIGACHQRDTPSIGWSWHTSQHVDHTGSATFSAYLNSLHCHNNSRTQFTIASRSFTPEDLSRRENIRLLLQPVLGKLDIYGLHGGTVGSDDSGVLLVGRGGSGKSTLVSWAVARGNCTLGDDFLLLPSDDSSDGSLSLGSLFSTAKLEPTSPSSELYPKGNPVVDGKRVVDLSHGAGRVIANQKIRAIAAVSVGTTSRIAEGSRHQIVQALLPYSAPLNDTPGGLIERLDRPLDTLPLYELTSGPDLDATLAILEEIAA
jgi:hypothetical protein